MNPTSMGSISPVNNMAISIFLMVIDIFLSTMLSLMVFYFKQLKKSIDEHKATVDSRMKEGEERFGKLEDDLLSLRSEVYKGYVTKDDFIRILGTFECKFKEVQDLIIRSFNSLREGKGIS